MQLKNTVIKNLSIVLVGKFNPSIVSPHWLSSKKAIRESEADNANVKIVHPEISDFSLSFAEIQVSQDRFIVNCENEADFDLARDLLVSIFTFLRETPVTGIGLNHIVHFGLENAKEYRNFGDWLVPLNNWNSKMRDPKLFEVKVIEPFEEGNPVKNTVSFSISEKIKQFGVKYVHNYHIEGAREREKSIANILLNNWGKSFDKSNEIFESIIGKFNG